jgi:DNA-binding cell septation regulator SpoVG
MSITISNARKINKGALRGFFDVELPSGLKLNGCTLIEKADGKRFVGLPSKEFVKADGTKSYTPVVDIPDRDARQKFQDAVLPLAERSLLS